MVATITREGGQSMPESHELSSKECARLLAAGVAGRVAVSTPTGPHIVPVNYSVRDEATLLRTTPYSLLGTYGRDAMLAFEVDGMDHEYQRGWSVVARGRGEVVDDAAELDEIMHSWPPRPWAAGQRTLVLRIPWTEVTGRQLGSWDLWQTLPVHRQA